MMSERRLFFWTALLSLALFFGRAEANHTLDTSARFPNDATTRSSAQPVSFTYTCGSGTTVLAVGLNVASSSNREGGAPTYNGVAMTQAGTVQYAASSPETRQEMWYMINPPTGSAYTISVPNTVTARTIKVMVASFKASAGNSSVFDAVSGNCNATSTNPTCSVTTTVGGDAIFAVVGDGITDFSPATTNRTNLWSMDMGTSGGGAQYYLATGITPGATAMSWTIGSDDWAAIAVAFKDTGNYRIWAGAGGGITGGAAGYSTEEGTGTQSYSYTGQGGAIAGGQASWKLPDNNFSNDSSIKAVYKFESGALTTDSKSTNTLTDSGSPTETTDHREGYSAVNLEADSSQYFSRTDASLSAGFPFKSGDANKKISVIFWMKTQSTVTQYIWSKYAAVTGGRTFAIVLNLDVDHLEIGPNVGHSGGDAFEGPRTSLSGLEVGNWYFVGITYDDSDRSYRIRVLNADLSLFENVTGTVTNNIYIAGSTIPFRVGANSASTATSFFDGNLDELVTFNRVLSAAEIDAIAAKTFDKTRSYTGSGGAIAGGAATYKRSFELDVEEGGAIVGGSGTGRHGRVYAISGGAIAGGEAGYTPTYVGGVQSYSFSMSGGGILGGAAAYLREVRASMLGGAVSAGVAGFKIGKMLLVSASGAVASGAATLKLGRSLIVVASGAIAGGAAVFKAGKKYLTSGGGIAAGMALFTRSRIFVVASAGAVAGGSVGLLRGVSFSMSGGSIASGVATLLRTVKAVAVGGAITGGFAVYHTSGLQSYSFPMSGGAIVGGLIDLKRSSIKTAGGGAISGGLALLKYGRNFVASGGCAVGGSILNLYEKIYEMLGGAVAGGMADYFHGGLFNPTWVKPTEVIQ